MYMYTNGQIYILIAKWHGRYIAVVLTHVQS